MNELISLPPFEGVTRFAWDLAWQSTLVGIATLVALRFLVRHPAARAWTVVLATGLCLAIPLVSVVVRASGLGLLNSQAHVAAIAPTIAAAPAPGLAGTPTSEAIIDDETMPVEIVAAANVNTLPAVDPTSDSSLAIRSDVSGPSLSVIAWLWSHAPAIATLCWAMLALTALIRLISGLASVRRLCREAVACDDAMILNSCRRAARAVGLRREPHVVISPHTGCPTVLAWGRPVLFIPPLARQKSARQWFSVFSHELAHVQRGDGWSQLVMEAATVLLPWQPMIHLLRHHHRQACEEACDDWALFAGADPIDFASTLTEWIPSEPNVLALDIGSGTSSVRRRIERLLRCSSPPRPELGNGWLLGSGTVATCVLCLLALLQTGTLQTRADDQPNSAEPSAGIAADRTTGHNEGSVSDSETQVHAPRQLVAILGEGRMQHWNSAEVLGFGPEHQTVFSRGRDETLKVWDLATGVALRGLQLPRSTSGYRWWNWDIEIRGQYCFDVLLSPDGNVLLLGKGDGTVEMLDAATFKRLRVLKIPGELPRKLAISADGKRLAALRLSTADGKTAAIVLDIATGQTVGSIHRKISDDLRGTRSAPWRWLELSPDGSKLALSRNGDATLWDVATGELMSEFGGGWSLRFSPDGGTLVTCSADQLQLWDVPTGQQKCSIRNFATSSQVAFSPAGDLLAIVDGSRVRVCRVDSGEQLWISYKHNALRHFTRPTIAFHRNGNTLALGAGHGVALFDVATGHEIGRDRVTALTSLAVDPQGGRLVTGDSNGHLAVWGVADGTRRQTWRAHEHQISPLAFSPDGRTLASASFEHLVVWNGTDGRLRHTIQPERAQRGSNPMPLRMAFTSDSASLMVGYRAREFKMWDVASGNPETCSQFDPDLLAIYPFAVTRGNRLIASTRVSPRRLGIWSLTTGKQTKTLSPYRGPTQFAVSHDGRRIAAAAPDDTISVWDLQLDKQIDIPKGHARRGHIRTLALSRDGRTLASGAEDGSVRLWNAATGEKLNTLQIGPRRGLIDQLAFSIDGRYLASKNGNGTVSILRIGPAWLALE